MQRMDALLLAPRRLARNVAPRFLPVRVVLTLLLAALAWRATVRDAAAQTFSFVSAFTEDVGRPTGLALDTLDGVPYLYVSDHDGGRVFRYNLNDGSRVLIAARGTANGQFLWPDGIAVEPVTHDLYIADRLLHRVTRLTRHGAFVMKWGDTGTLTNRFGHTGAGTAPGQFNGPVGVALDAAGHVYTTEHENHRVQKFRVTQDAGSWNVETLTTWGSGGSGPGQFNTPYGITLDAAGNVWVADGFNSRLQKFSANGELLGQIVVRGPTEPHLVNTWVTVDAAGALYVGITSDPNTGGDIANQRIEKFSPAGVSLGKWGSYGGGTGQFRLPFGIVIHAATNRAYVTDYDNNRIQIFSLGEPTTPPPPALPPPPPPAPAPTAARLVNLSSRQRIVAGDTTRGAIAGFVVAGTTPRPMLVRAVGPGLASFAVTDPLANPRLQIFDAASRITAENDDWNASPEVTAAAERAGAFRLGATSLDAAVMVTLAPGAYTAQVTAATGSGVVLLEVYDVAPSATTDSEKLVNLSTRGFVDTGEGQLVAGFVVSGDAPKRVLVRGIGPALGAFNVNGALVDPVLNVYATGSASPLARNDNWETPQPFGAGQAVATAAEIAAAARAAGAFALSSGSRDASVVLTLAPGSYSAVVSGANNSSGVGLVEVFELPSP